MSGVLKKICCMYKINFLFWSNYIFSSVGSGLLIVFGVLFFVSGVEAQAPEDALLRSSDSKNNFGASVATGAESIFVGAPKEKGPLGSKEGVGAVYVFEHSSNAHSKSTWHEAQILRASNAGEEDRFGYSVAVEGDWAVVGTRREDGPSDKERKMGAAYVFKRSNGTWKETQILRAPRGVEAEFGFSVAIDDNRILVGAPYQNNWRRIDYYLPEFKKTGAAYVFERSDSTWQMVQDLRPSNAESGDRFGWSVALDGTHALVGAPYEDGTSDEKENVGAAYVYEQTDFDDHTILRYSNAYNDGQFGWSVALDGSQALVGAAGKGNAAYVFEHSETNGWSKYEDQTLSPSSAYQGGKFGAAVDIEEKRIFVGDPDVKDDHGAVYIYNLSSDGWSEWLLDSIWSKNEDQILYPSKKHGRGGFGFSISTNEKRAIIGDFMPDYGRAEDAWSGAVYVFE